MFVYTFYTWLLANLLHPILFLAVGVIHSESFENAGEVSFIEIGFIKAYVLLLFVSLLFSLPCLLISWMLLAMIVPSHYTQSARFALWLASSALLVVLEVLAISMGMHEEIGSWTFIWVAPPLIATWGSIILRRRQFKNLIWEYSIHRYK